MDPDGGLARPADGEARLGHRLQAHVVEDRQHVGQRRRQGAAIELEAELDRVVGGRAIGAHGHFPVLGHGVDHGQARQGLFRREAVAVAGGERLAVAAQGFGHLGRRPAGRAHGVLEAIFPGAGRLGDGDLQRLQVRRGVVARGEADDVVDARQRRVGEAGIGGRDPAAIGAGQDPPGPRRQIRVIVVARQEQQDRGEALEGVLALEDAHPRPVVEVEDAQRLVEQLALAHLEQLVARIVLDDVPQALFVVAARRGFGAVQDVGDLFADQRHGAGRLVIGLGGEQADEADLTDRAALGVEALDAHIVHVATPVDPALDVGLGDGQRRIGQQAILDVGQQDGGLVGAPQDVAAGVAQHAQAVLGLVQRLLGRVVAAPGARIFVDPPAQEHELLGLQPGQEGDLFRPGPVALLQLGERLAHQVQHRREVIHGGADVLQGLGDARDQGLLAVGADAVQDHLDHGFAAGCARLAPEAGAVALRLDDGVEQGADREALVGDFAHDRVDQERRVVLDDFQPVQALLVAGHRRDADCRSTAAAAFAEPPEVGQVGGELVGGDLGQLVRAGVGRGLLGEDLGGLRGRVALEGGQEGFLDR